MKLGTLVATGRTSDVYEFGREAVVKIPRPHVPLLWAEIEAELTGIIHGFGLPAPAVLDVVRIEGRPCVVLERVGGTVMWERMLSHRGDVVGLVDELVALQRRIHSAGLPAGIPDLVGRLRSKVADSSELPAADRNEAHMLIDSLPAGAAILHGDLHPGNVLLGPDGPVAIDWFDVSIGHAVADVVRTSLLIRPGLVTADHLHLPGADQALLEVMHRRYIAQWSELLGSNDVLPRWEAVIAAARISERAQADAQPLVSLWNERSNPARSSMLLV